MKNMLIVVLVLVVAALGFYVYMQQEGPMTPDEGDMATTTDDMTDTKDDMSQKDTETVIGRSAQGRDITAYHFGTGDTELLFVGGMHGGYSWNTALVAYEMMDYLEANAGAVPDNVRVTIIPSLNPDGQQKIVGSAGRFARADIPAGTDTVPGRFNSNGVDLNRNFDCDWQAEGVWRGQAVDAGGNAFSEPESQAIRGYVEGNDIAAVVVWYSSAGGVYASNCHGGILPETRSLMNVFAEASGYPAYENFDFYETTGDMTNWLAKEGVPAISVLLTNHSDTERTKNEAGVAAVLQHYAE